MEFTEFCTLSHTGNLHFQKDVFSRDILSYLLDTSHLLPVAFCDVKNERLDSTKKYKMQVKENEYSVLWCCHSSHLGPNPTGIGPGLPSSKPST